MKECIKCARIFFASSRHRKCPKCREIDRKHKCDECGTLIWENSKRCSKCFNKKVKHYRKRNGRVYHNGYILLRIPEHPRANSNNGYVFEHIVNMENKLGRYLLPGENIHHINGMRDDNRIENLELWIKPQPAGVRVEDAVKRAEEIIKLYKGL